MLFTPQTRRWGIRLCIVMLCIAALALTVSAETARTVPGNMQPVSVNVSPQATPRVQPAPDRIIVATPTPVPQRAVVTTTVTTVPVVNDPRVMPVVTTATARPTQGPVVVVQKGKTAGITPTVTPGTTIVIVGKTQVTAVNPADLAKERLEVSTNGVKDPKTGDVLSPDKGAGLPGDGRKMPSAEDQWNNRFGSAGTGDLLGGTPFDSNPLGNPMDDFLNQHGGNIPDPLAASGSGGSGYSPREGSSGDSAVVKNEDGSFSVLVETKNSGGDGQNREFVLIDFDANGDYKTDGDRQMGNEVFGNQRSDISVGTTTLLIAKAEANPVKTGGSHGQQYEGEGGYTGGGSHGANDLIIGSSGRMTGNVPGGYDPGTSGLGQDTGGKTPKVFEAIVKYVAAGGKVHGSKGGYQPGDSGQGGDIGGAAESRIAGLKNALSSHRFIIDPDATYAEQVPWWLEERVSPDEMAAAAQVSAVQAGVAKEAAAGNAGAGMAR